MQVLPLFSHSSKLVHLQTIIAFLQCTSLLLLRPCVVFILVLYTYPARVPYTEEGRRSNKGRKGKNFFCVPPPPPPSPHLSSSLPSLPHQRHITFLERGKKGCQKIDKKSHFGGGNCLNHCWQLSTLTYFFKKNQICFLQGEKNREFCQSPSLMGNRGASSSSRFPPLLLAAWMGSGLGSTRKKREKEEIDCAFPTHSGRGRRRVVLKEEEEGVGWPPPPPPLRLGCHKISLGQKKEEREREKKAERPKINMALATEPSSLLFPSSPQ